MSAFTLYLLSFLCLCGFFFSQLNTPYELRISDCSSDACSSDLLRAVIVVDLGDQRAEAHAVFYRLALRAHHGRVLQAACQPVAAPVDLAQALLVVDVVAVLAAVAVARRPGDNGADVVTFLLQPPQLVLKARETFGRDQATDGLDHELRKDPKPRQPHSEERRV